MTPLDLDAIEAELIAYPDALESWAVVHGQKLIDALRTYRSEMPTIWDDPANKGYPCMERPMTPAEVKRTIDKLLARVDELEADALREAVAKIMPIRVNNGPDYAEVYFADGSTHKTQAMTMNPADWQAIADAYAAPPITGKEEGPQKQEIVP